MAEKLTLKNGMRSPYGSIGWFVDYVKSIVQDKYGSDMLYQGGLRIYTTIDPKLQTAALSAVQTVWDQAKKDKVFVESDRDSLGVFQPQVGMVSVDPRTGYILAMVGGTNYDETNFNRVLAPRQPGSTFKIFDYTAAFDNGVTFPSEIVASQPTDFGGWSPPEWLGTNQWFGRISVANAIKESSNIIAANNTQGWTRQGDLLRSKDGCHIPPATICVSLDRQLRDLAPGNGRSILDNRQWRSPDHTVSNPANRNTGRHDDRGAQLRCDPGRANLDCLDCASNDERRIREHTQRIYQRTAGSRENRQHERLARRLVRWLYSRIVHGDPYRGRRYASRHVCYPERRIAVSSHDVESIHAAGYQA
jgi:hypothetical protein